MCILRYISPRLKIQNFFIVFLYEIFCDFFIKLDCPWIYFIVREIKCSKIMNDISTSDNNDSFFSQRSKFLTELKKGFCSYKIIKAQRNHGDIGIRKHMDEYGPYSMIETTMGISGNIETRFREEIRYFSCYTLTSKSSISGPIKFRRKSSHIVDHLRMFCSGYTSFIFSDPVRRKHKYCPRFLDRFSDLFPILSIGIFFDRIHRTSMSDKNNGHFCIHSTILESILWGTTHLSGIQISKCLHNFRLRIHHEGSIVSDRLIDRFSRHNENFCIITS